MNNMHIPLIITSKISIHWHISILIWDSIGYTQRIDQLICYQIIFIWFPILFLQICHQWLVPGNSELLNQL